MQIRSPSTTTDDHHPHCCKQCNRSRWWSKVDCSVAGRRNDQLCLANRQNKKNNLIVSPLGSDCLFSNCQCIFFVITLHLHNLCDKTESFLLLFVNMYCTHSRLQTDQVKIVFSWQLHTHLISGGAGQETRPLPPVDKYWPVSQFGSHFKTARSIRLSFFRHILLGNVQAQLLFAVQRFEAWSG